MTRFEPGTADPRTRSLLAFAALAAISVAAGWGIYSDHRKILGLLGLVTFVVLFRRWRFEDFFFLTVATAILGHVRYTVIQDEFARDKWIALFALGVVAAVAVALRLTDPQWPGLVHVPLAVLVLVSLFSLTWSSHPWLSLAKAGVWCVGAFIAFVGVWTYARDAGRIRRLVDAHVVALLLVLPVSVAALLVSLPGGWVAGRFRSIFENPNNLGEWTSQSLPLLFVMATGESRTWWRRGSLALLACAVVVGFLSGSRGGIGGAAIGIALACVLRWPRRSAALAAVAVVAITFLRLYEVRMDALERVTSNIVREESLEDLSTRKLAWELGRLIVEQRPWLGHGFGLGDVLYVDYGMDLTVDAIPPSVHSSYLDAAMNLGLVGLGALIAIQALAAWGGLRAFRADPKGASGLLALALLASVVGSSAHAVVETTLLSMGNPWSLPFWIFLACLVRLGHLAIPPRSGSPADVAT